jgi:hypothetical protein
MLTRQLGSSTITYSPNSERASPVIARTTLDRSAAILLQPHFYFTCDDDFMDFGDGSIYVAMMAVLGALLAGIMGNTSGLGASLGLVPTLIIGPVIAVVAAFIMAGIIQVLCRSLGSTSHFGDSFHISASAAVFIPISQLLSALPLLILSMGWTWWVVSRGVIYLHHVEPRKAEIAFALLYAGLFILAAANH